MKQIYSVPRNNEIISRYYSGEKARALALEYKISRTRVFQIVRPEQHKNSSRKHQFLFEHVITLDEYKSILDLQGGVCAICKTSNPGKGIGGQRNNLSIDHCHKTMEVRGLLCNRCNRAIGSFEDRPDLLIEAAKYLTISRTGKYSKPRRVRRGKVS